MPALAVCDALQSLHKGVELLYIGQADSMEERIVRAKGLAFAPVRAGKFRRRHFDSGVAKLLNHQTLGPNSRDAFRTVAGVHDAWNVIRRFKPDVTFIKGGFVGVPVGLAARMLGVPYIIHESDVSPGLANRLLGRWAAAIATGFPAKYYSQWQDKHVEFVGNPVRPEIMAAHRLAGLAKFKLDESQPVLLITGGSQGSREINEAVLAGLDELLELAQIIHVTGESEFERVQFNLNRQASQPDPARYKVSAFLNAEMPLALAAADVVVCRAGMNTVAELAVLEKPTILIPNTDMAAHQMANARVLARAGAARVLSGESVTAAKLVGEVRLILSDEAEQQRLAKAIGSFASRQAAEDLAQLILKIGAASTKEGSGV